ncbi:hypothetical protein THAOC_36146, partial [Thalassiosira oceanica]
MWARNADASVSDASKPQPTRVIGEEIESPSRRGCLHRRLSHVGLILRLRVQAKPPHSAASVYFVSGKRDPGIRYTSVSAAKKGAAARRRPRCHKNKNSDRHRHPSIAIGHSIDRGLRVAWTALRGRKDAHSAFRGKSALSCFLRHVALGEIISTYDLTKKITEYGRATNKAFVEGLTTYCIMALRATGNVYNILKEHSDDGVPYGCPEGSVDTSMRGRYQDQEGLAFHESYDADETSRKLDYVITQVDICRLERMEKHACGSLGVSCIDDIPSHVFQSKSNDLSLILESDGDDDGSEDVSEFLKRNEHIIDDYSTKLQDELEFSWMVVPECPEEGDDLTRLSQESSSHAEAQAASDDEDTAKTDI